MAIQPLEFLTTIKENVTTGTFLGTVSNGPGEPEIISLNISETYVFVDDSTHMAYEWEQTETNWHFYTVGNAIYASTPFDYEMLWDQWLDDDRIWLNVFATDTQGKETDIAFYITIIDVDETKRGTSGDDRMVGIATTVNQFEGGAGNDVMIGAAFEDYFKGDTGDDRLFGNDGSDSLDGGAGNDRIIGGKGGDTLIGGAGDDILDGGAGGSHWETIQGSDEYILVPNRLTGGAGKDRLIDSGDDRFIYDSITDSLPKARDVIVNWTGKSTIALQGIDANTKVAGNNTFRFIGTKDFAGKAGELRYEKIKSDTYIYADVNGDSKADFSIILDDRATLHASDFIL